MENLTNIQSISLTETEDTYSVIALCEDGSVWLKSASGVKSLSQQEWTCINKGQNNN